MRRPETLLLHGPWPDHTPDPDDETLEELREAFSGGWIIWRALSAQRTSGDWCACRNNDGTPAGLSAPSPGALRELLEEADR